MIAQHRAQRSAGLVVRKLVFESRSDGTFFLAGTGICAVPAGTRIDFRTVPSTTLRFVLGCHPTPCGLRAATDERSLGTKPRFDLVAGGSWLVAL